MERISRVLLLLSVGILGSGCAVFSPDLAKSPPPLVDMEEPLDQQEEPRDEPARRKLPAGGFSGVYVLDGSDSLDDLAGESRGVTVARVVENSPGAVAGLENGDIILEVKVGATGTPRAINWTSEWRRFELDTQPGTEFEVLYDRAGVERRASLTLVPRLHPADRGVGARYREEQRVGLVLRTATEVEARRLELGPGAGAVVVGLSRASPWRQADLKFGDILLEVDDVVVAHPQVVLEAIRAADANHSFEIVFARRGQRHVVEAGVSSRLSELQTFSIPILFNWEDQRDYNEWSILLGLVGHRSTAAAWEFRLLWLITFSGGDSDKLEEVDP